MRLAIFIRKEKRNVKMAILATSQADDVFSHATDAGKWVKLPTIAIHLELSSLSNSMRERRRKKKKQIPVHMTPFTFE